MKFCPATRRRLPLVTRESYDAFTSRYQTVTDICHARNLNAHVVKRRLAEAGCQPAFDEDVTGNAIYERTQALEAVLLDCPPSGAVWAKSHPGASRRVRVQWLPFPDPHQEGDCQA